MGSAEQDHWKQKYLASLDRLERQEKQFQQVEELLRTGISRVALAAQGVDRNLDRDLGELRKVIRRGKAYEDLNRIVDSISYSVKQLEDSKAETSENPSASCLLHLVEQLDVGEKFEKQKNRISKSLRKLKPDQSVDRCLQQTIELCNSVLNNNLPSPKKSWLQNMFGAGEDLSDVEVNYPEGAEPPEARFSNKSDPRLPLLLLMRQLPESVLPKVALSGLEQTVKHLEPQMVPQNALSDYTDDMQKVLNQSVAKITAVLKKASAAAPAAKNAEHDSKTSVEQFCIQLLESLSFPEEFQVSVNALRNRIVDGLAAAELGGVVHALADLIMATRQHIETERNELQRFLMQLSEHLQTVDKQVSGAQSLYREDIKQREMMHYSLNEQMQHLQSSTQQAQDLASLKVLIREQVLGIKQHFDKQNQLGVERQQKMAQALAQTTVRLQQLEQESQQLRKRLSDEHSQAIHDALTGIYNRLAYQERVEQEYARWKRYRKPLSLVIFDVDHFKRINDKYGHKAGDKALRMIAKYLKQTVRETDFVARYGGEEFVVIMPETDLRSALTVANKLREKISEVYFHYADEKVLVSISAGVAAFKDLDTVESVFQRADQALYQAKHNGRNQCAAAD